MPGPIKKKVAILGGGVGALSTAFEITSQPDWQSNYEITVYQMGWRLGGKGASGRNARVANRIQEHGLHLWMGFYENAFDMIRRAYAYCDENNLTPGTPFPTYKEAFSPMNFTAVAEQYPAGTWNIWPIFWPPNNEMPGAPDGADAPREFDFSTPWGYVVALIAWVRSEVDRVTRDHNLLHGILANLCDDLLAFTEHRGELPNNDSLVHRIERFVLSRSSDPRDHTEEDYIRLISGLECFHKQIIGTLETFLERDTEIRHLLITVDTGIAIAKGMVADDVIGRGFRSIDRYDFIEWLGRHGCHNATSPLTISMYDACFGYASGDPNQRNMGAGSTLYGALRLIFTYRGALMWWMEAGMGDTIFTPIYKALQHRGVKFEFFHKITRLTPSENGTSVSTIEIDVQSQAKPELADGYCPVYEVKGLLCWPSEPFYAQLVNGDTLQDAQYVNRDLESWWTDLPPLAHKTLCAGRDFDVVLMGISLGALPYICPEFPAADKTGKWGQMIDEIQVVRTQAFQLWLNKSAGDMGWPYAARAAPVLCGFVEPYDTWAQMDHLIKRECWPPGVCRQIAYFCNAAPMDPEQKPFNDPNYPKRQLEVARSAALQFLETHAKTIWADGVNSGDLVGYEPGQRDVLESQFVRINIDPSEQYVLSVKGSTEFRLAPGDSLFNNLFLAGDWTLVDVNLGCVEAAVQSGRLASFAITGAPDFMYGAFRQRLVFAKPA